MLYTTVSPPYTITLETRAPLPPNATLDLRGLLVGASISDGIATTTGAVHAALVSTDAAGIPVPHWALFLGDGRKTFVLAECFADTGCGFTYIDPAHYDGESHVPPTVWTPEPRTGKMLLFALVMGAVLGGRR
jgi:hypothetical protein